MVTELGSTFSFPGSSFHFIMNHAIKNIFLQLQYKPSLFTAVVKGSCIPELRGIRNGAERQKYTALQIILMQNL